MGDRGGIENRIATRFRRVQPVLFAAAGGATAHKTVSANVSSGGMMLVTRKDRFPASGTLLNLMAKPDLGSKLSHEQIPCRIVYTRYASDTNLSFAGLEFVGELSDQSERALGLSNGEARVTRAIKTLEELEDICREPTATPESPREVQDIRSIRPAISGHESQMAVARDAFVKASSEFVIDWVKGRSREAVVERYEHSLALGKSGLSAMKKDLDALSADYPELVGAQFGVNGIWPEPSAGVMETHSEPGAHPYCDLESGQPSSAIMEELGLLIGFAGVLFVKHGFAALDGQSDWVSTGKDGSRVGYRGELRISEAMSGSLERMARVYDDLCEAAGRLEALEADASREEVGGMWDAL